MGKRRAIKKVAEDLEGVLHMLADRPHTTAEISTVLGISRNSVNYWLNKEHRKVIRSANWTRKAGHTWSLRQPKVKAPPKVKDFDLSTAEAHRTIAMVAGISPVALGEPSAKDLVEAIKLIRKVGGRVLFE
jgi:hypothetical protein